MNTVSNQSYVNLNSTWPFKLSSIRLVHNLNHVWWQKQPIFYSPWFTNCFHKRKATVLFNEWWTSRLDPYYLWKLMMEIQWKTKKGWWLESLVNSIHHKIIYIFTRTMETSERCNSSYRWFWLYLYHFYRLKWGRRLNLSLQGVVLNVGSGVWVGALQLNRCLCKYESLHHIIK